MCTAIWCHIITATSCPATHLQPPKTGELGSGHKNVKKKKTHHVFVKKQKKQNKKAIFFRICLHLSLSNYNQMLPI